MNAATENNPNSVRIDGDVSIETQLNTLGALGGRRVRAEDIEAAIHSKQFFTAAEGVVGAASSDSAPPPYDPVLHLTVYCVLVLKNGFTVTGIASKADPVGFDRKVGEWIALQDAQRKVWPFLNFRLREQIASEAAGMVQAAGKQS